MFRLIRSAAGKPARGIGDPHLSGRLLVALTGAVALLLITNLFALRELRTLGRSGQWVTHTEQVRFELQQLWGQLLEIESSTRSYAISGDDRFLASYHRAPADIASELSRLGALTADNPVQQALIERLRSQTTERLITARQVVEAVQTGDLAAARAALSARTDEPSMTGLRTVIGQMQTEEDRLLLVRRQALDLAHAQSVRAIWLWTCSPSPWCSRSPSSRDEMHYDTPACRRPSRQR